MDALFVGTVGRVVERVQAYVCVLWGGYGKPRVRTQKRRVNIEECCPSKRIATPSGRLRRDLLCLARQCRVSFRFSYLRVCIVPCMRVKNICFVHIYLYTLFNMRNTYRTWRVACWRRLHRKEVTSMNPALLCRTLIAFGERALRARCPSRCGR